MAATKTPPATKNVPPPPVPDTAPIEPPTLTLTPTTVAPETPEVEPVEVKVYPVYAWDVPSINEGYSLRIEVRNADTVEAARYYALQFKIGKDDEEKKIYARSLSESEQNWVKTVEPRVVRDTTDLSIDYQNALIANKKLKSENEGFAYTKGMFSTLGIDVFKPYEWVTKVTTDAENRVRQADELRDGKHRKMCEDLANLRAHSIEVEKILGFYVAPPEEAPEPDYAARGLVVLYPSQDMMDLKDHIFPRLKDVPSACRKPNEPMNDIETAGYKQLDRLVDSYITGFGPRMTAGDTERTGIVAFVNYLKTIIKEE